MNTSNEAYKDEEKLREAYEKYNTQIDVADEFGCSQATIGNWMDKFGINSTQSHSEVRDRDFTPTLNTECEFCGDDFYKRPTHKEESNNHFCSNDCYSSWQSENRVGEDHHQYDRIEVSCSNCGEMKEVLPSHHKEVDNHYCDPHCQAENEDREGRNNSFWSGGKTREECGYCGEEFELYPYRLDEANINFCNPSCRSDWLSENQVGENHHQWKGGGIYYGESWPRMRSKVQERDGNKCQLCGDSEEEIGQTPDTHHIVPVRSFDEYENAHTMENMVQVCRGCHRTLETYGPQKQREMVS